MDIFLYAYRTNYDISQYRIIIYEYLVINSTE